MSPISIQTKNSIPVIIPAGRIDSTSGPELEKALGSILEQSKFLIIDLSNCKYLSSAGIRILLLSAKKMIARGGNLFLAGVLPEVFQVLEMGGLHQVFRLVDNSEAAMTEIDGIQSKSGGSQEWMNGAYSFHYHPSDEKREVSHIWGEAGIAGYDELDISIGFGSAADHPDEDIQAEGLFVTCGGCAGFIPDDKGRAPDFRIPKIPSHAGVFVKQAVSFSQKPAGRVSLSKPGAISVSLLAEGLRTLKQKLSSGRHDLCATVIADFNTETPSVMVCLFTDPESADLISKAGLHLIPGAGAVGAQSANLSGIRFILAEMPDASAGITLSDFLKNAFTFENILHVAVSPAEDQLTNPIAWLFISDGLADASGKRLVIETEPACQFEPHEAFLTRRLYTDSTRVSIKQIHGGYSAQAYQVTSFDQEGRKLRPTVLKIANRAMISRESDRCRRFAMPYILNNSAMVLGTEFFGDTGALRYNFVGIGGENAPLKWLTHYFKTWPPEQLEPLFDKIFLQILNPWYGQPIKETVYPFRDHDPRSTFFPKLCETASELLSVSPDEPFIHIEETGQKLVNPYWFLKYEFVKQRDTGMDYYTGICHGDLNMQNILLDEDMNVYLIDFSETKPRSVISDFARLEAVFMVDNAPLDNESDLDDYIRFISDFYGKVQFDARPLNNYRGAHHAEVTKNVSLTLKMRDYAFASVKGHPDCAPYCLALLEWVLPIVCYSSATLAHKRVSMIVSGLICTALLQTHPSECLHSRGHR
jgi:anti-anti-sigma factor